MQEKWGVLTGDAERKNWKTREESLEKQCKIVHWRTCKSTLRKVEEQEMIQTKDHQNREWGAQKLPEDGKLVTFQDLKMERFWALRQQWEETDVNRERP